MTLAQSLLLLPCIYSREGTDTYLADDLSDEVFDDFPDEARWGVPPLATSSHRGLFVSEACAFAESGSAKTSAKPEGSRGVEGM